jgi:HSP20 family protein
MKTECATVEELMMSKAKKKAKAPKKSVAAKKAAAPKKAKAKTSAPMAAEHPEGMLSRMAAMREEMDNLFSSMSRSFGLPEFKMPAFDMPAPAPFTDVRFEVSETDKAVEVKAEVPGLAENEIKIELAEGLLTVKGEKQESREEKKKAYHVRERRYGSFSRSFRVPESVIEEDIAAELQKGVLSITLPKRAAQKRRPKAIKVAEAG